MDETAVVPLEDIRIDEKLNYVEKPIAILERKTKTLRARVLLSFVVSPVQLIVGFQFNQQPVNVWGNNNLMIRHRQEARRGFEAC